MKEAFPKLMTVGAVASLVVVAACGGSGGAPELDDSPEAEAFRYRSAVMEIAAYKAVRIGGMHREEIPLDEDVFVDSTQDLAAVSAMMLEGFMPEGAVGPSRAMPEVWENWSDFEQKAQAFQDAVEMLATTAEQEGFEAARGLVQPMLGTCGDCHRAYRASEEE